MFNNILYFLIVLLIFNISYPDTTQDKSLVYSLGMIFWCWFLFAFYCHMAAKRLLVRKGKGEIGRLTAEYHGLVLRLSILAIFLFTLDIYLFDLKYWLQFIPGIKPLSFMHGLLAIALFIFYLATIWYWVQPLYEEAFQAVLTKRSFIISNIKLNMPIVFPYLILTFAVDLIDLSPWQSVKDIMERSEGQIIFFTFFIGILVVFIPSLIQYWWGCRPYEMSDRVKALKSFLQELRFKYRELLNWPIFEGRMMTAGIMGIVPRYRYILVTDSLMEVLNMEELKAVMAHEVGHAKHHHLIFYVLFFLGFVVSIMGLFDFEYYAEMIAYFLNEYLKSISSPNLFFALYSIPIMLAMLIYFRFVMGFFMRNFERQADLYSAVVMRSPTPAMNALEKIAILSGKSRNLPSWHHYSIAERVDCLSRTLNDPGLIKRHNRFVRMSTLVFFIFMIIAGYAFNFGTLKQDLYYYTIGGHVQGKLVTEPDNIKLLDQFGNICIKTERFQKAIEIYEDILRVDPYQATALNNLAWILVTATDENLRDPVRAIALAREAVALERIPVFLDTLAEAYWVSGLDQKAIETINEAIQLEKVDDRYFEKQLKKFKTSKPSI
ncbi:MAG: M48 family metalloprotease [Deltaproteobacteria bacterium]|nr:M48 family metalloprotease [Deltaproteobacteria bacterium]